MAFLRRHRTALVPLFIAAIGAGGAVLLLPSGSEEPRNVLPSVLRIVSEQRQERIDCRNDHTREWRVVRAIEYTDPATGKSRRDEILSTIREVGSALCYRDLQGRWQPSVDQWEATASGFVADRRACRVHAAATLDGGCTLIANGAAVRLRPRSLMWSDGKTTVPAATLDPTAPARISRDDPSTLVLDGAVAGESRGDVELVLQGPTFHQNIRLDGPLVLPDGFDAQRTHLYILTAIEPLQLPLNVALTVHNGESAAAQTAGFGAPSLTTSATPALVTTPLWTSGDARPQELFAVLASNVCDSAPGRPRGLQAERGLWRDPADGRLYLVERVPYTWLAAAAYPVTFDPVLRTGTIGTETWTADATYRITGNVYVGGDRTLTIEPGTVIKFNAGKSINVTASGAKIIAKGEPFRTIVFTSTQDDNSGEDLTEGTGTPRPGDYSRAIWIGSSASADCRIEYCKIGYATMGISASKDFGMIRHCIISTCSGAGVYLSGSSMPDVFNNLIVACGGSLEAYDSGGSQCTMRNNTIACPSALASIYLSTNNASSRFTIENNLLTTPMEIGICRLPYYSSSTVTASNSAYYGVETQTYGRFTNSNPVTLGADPYDTANTQLGAYFINKSANPGGHQLVDAGTGSADTLYDGPEGFDVGPPEHVTESITGQATWSTRPGDSGLADIGYHHPRIDKLITGDIWCSTGDTLTIEPGVVVAVAGDSVLSVADDGVLRCNGDPRAYIQFPAGRAASMAIETPRRTAVAVNVDRAIAFDRSSRGSASVTYTRFLGNWCGLRTCSHPDPPYAPGSHTIAHCTFERCYSGYNACGTDVLLRNIHCDNCSCGFVLDFDHEAHTFEAHNCTFSRSSRGIEISEGDNPGLRIALLDCLFASCQNGLRLASEPPPSAPIDYNAYAACQSPIRLAYTSPESDGALGPHSLDLGSASPFSTAWSAWRDQWRLDQSKVWPTGCINAGSRHVAQARLEHTTTALDALELADKDRVDIGYHYPTALTVTDSHFDNTGPDAVLIIYRFASATADRILRIYNGAGILVYEAANPSLDTMLSVTWDGTGNQDEWNGVTLDAGTYTAVVTAGGTLEPFAVFNLYIEQSGNLGITHPETGARLGWH